VSFLTKLPEHLYRPDAFANFKVVNDFDVGTARAMAWISQLAYETDEPDKIKRVLKLWGLTLLDDGVVIAEVNTPLPQASTHCFVAANADATIIAFAGTDPVVLANWITDFDIHLDETSAANGYVTAADAVWPRLKALLAKRQKPANRVFVTGHSLGGALAAIIAQRVVVESAGDIEAVYTFGMPRPGSKDFASAYNLRLGSSTYRLVHGDDLVPTVAPSFLKFHHLGRFLHCDRLGRFDKTKLEAGSDSDDPAFVKGVAGDLAALLQGPLSGILSVSTRIKLAATLLAGFPSSGMRTDPGGILIELLPPRLRDHMPDRYIQACGSAASP
jgi:triacylglycerol lipase